MTKEIEESLVREDVMAHRWASGYRLECHHFSLKVRKRWEKFFFTISDLWLVLSGNTGRTRKTWSGWETGECELLLRKETLRKIFSEFFYSSLGDCMFLLEAAALHICLLKHFTKLFITSCTSLTFWKTSRVPISIRGQTGLCFLLSYCLKGLTKPEHTAAWFMCFMLEVLGLVQEYIGREERC